MEIIKVPLTTARKLHKRFDNWYKIEPVPLKDGTWYVTVEAIQYLKEHFIDHASYDNRTAIRNKATALRDTVKSVTKEKLEDNLLSQYAIKSTVTDGKARPDLTDPETAEYYTKMNSLKANFEDVK